MRVLPAVSLLLAAPLLAQQQPALPILGETIEVSIVSLDVIVTDRQGNRVRGLKPSDFEVRENGKLQTITNFAEYTVDGPPVSVGAPVSSAARPPAEDSRPPQNPRTMVLFVERVQLLPPDADRLFASMEETVRSVVRPGDAVAIVTWDRAMKVVRDFTDDVEALSSTIRELREVSKRVMLPDAESIQRRQEEQDRLAVLYAGSGVGPPDQMLTDSIMLARRALSRMRFKVHSLKSLINLMAPAQGKKVLLMATRRFSEFAGAEFFPGGQVPQDHRIELSTSEIRKSVQDAANAAGVTVYAVYPPGLRTGSAFSAEFAPDISTMNNPDRDLESNAFDYNVLANEAVALDEIARATGGLSAWGAGSITVLMPKVIEDMSTYYSLAFRASPGKKKEHRITVRTIDRQYQVRSRSAYVEKSESDRMADRVVAALFRPELQNTLAVHAELGEPAVKRGRVSIKLKVRIPIGNLTVLPDGRHHAGAFTVFAAAGGRVGVVSDVIRKTQAFQIPSSDLGRARASHYSYELTVMTDGAAEHVSVGVLDEVSKQYGIVRLPLGHPER
ncbi:MAG TPA: VWA domain-containing protein [Thermoanaerobaculia bacterium]|nr:VWA domain-containing protein [Thermoanaerobaculia bacterium]